MAQHTPQQPPSLQKSPTRDYEKLLRRCIDGDAIVGIIGLGYVGLPLAQTFHAAGFHVIGYDIDEDKIQKLREGVSYIQHIDATIVQNLASSPSFQSTSVFAKLEHCDALIICLPTPVGPHNEPDMTYVFSAVEKIASSLKPCRLIILESTTYPGATDTDVVEILSRSSLSFGSDFFVAFSPERENPGSLDFSTNDIPKLVGGVDSRSGNLAEALYRRGGFSQPVLVSSARIAECAKLLENVYRSVNIALVNELKGIFDSFDVNIWDVLDAAETKPFGFHRFNPGPGVGGHCIPVDPFYLTWKAKEKGVQSNFIELAAVVNSRMPSVVVSTVQAALNSERKSVNGSSILLLGVTYKSNVDDLRESPALVIWSKLLNLGADVSYFDPFAPVMNKTRRFPRLSEERSITIDGPADVDRFDAIVLVTHHDQFDDYKFLKGFPGPVIDTRNRIPAQLGLNVLL